MRQSPKDRRGFEKKEAKVTKGWVSISNGPSEGLPELLASRLSNRSVWAKLVELIECHARKRKTVECPRTVPKPNTDFFFVAFASFCSNFLCLLPCVIEIE
jgi:hypothetical protein